LLPSISYGPSCPSHCPMGLLSATPCAFEVVAAFSVLFSTPVLRAERKSSDRIPLRWTLRRGALPLHTGSRTCSFGWRAPRPSPPRDRAGLSKSPPVFGDGRSLLQPARWWEAARSGFSPPSGCSRARAAPPHDTRSHSSWRLRSLLFSIPR